MEVDRDDFGVRQAEMTARWYENVKKNHPDVEAYIRTRHNAYLGRWSEAARFMDDGARILDIGGGNLFPRLVDFFKQKQFLYSYLDVDPACVDGSRALAESMELKGANFDHGYNDSLPFGDGAFDAIFSSHCLEHSFDLKKTFTEVNRVLRADANLTMAVPFGWEENPEHPYFFGPSEWIALITDAGFRIRVAQIGCEYPETGHDYFVAAQKQSAVGAFRIDPSNYTKSEFDFISPFDARIQYSGGADHRADHVIMADDRWSITFDPPAGAREVLPILLRHDWSGIIEINWGQKNAREDCYSWFTYPQPVRIESDPQNAGAPVQIAVAGKNPASFSKQGVLHGMLVR